jgi:uncharacterized membrane protein YfcA
VSWELVILFGFGVGVMVGTTGVGGGSLMTPALILAFGVQPRIAIGTDLAYAAVTKTLGGWRHFRQRTVDLRIALWLATGSVPGALGGVYLLHALEHALGKKRFDATLLALVAVALLLTGLAVLVRSLTKAAGSRETVDPFELRHRLAAVAIGLAVGFVLGLTSAGSGSLIAVGLLTIYRLSPRRVVGTDVFHAAMLLWVAATAHLVSGNVDLGLAGNILIGSLPGVWIGSALAVRLPEGGLRPTLAVVLLAAGLALLNKAGASFPLFLVFAAPAAIGGALLVLHRLRSPRAPQPVLAAQAGPAPQPATAAVQATAR